MTLYCKLIAGVPGVVNMTRAQLVHAETCLPVEPTVEDLDGTGFAIWIPAELPAHDREHKALEAAAERVEPGIWEQRWIIVPLDPLELASSIETRKAALWATAKAERDRRELDDDATAPTPFGAAQCNDRSKLKISGMVQMASIAQAAGQPFEEEFTLFDNSVAVLDAAGAIALGVAVGSHVSAIHAHARILRGQINAAGTHAALDAIEAQLLVAWP